METDEPSTSSTSMETEDIVSSTSAVPFVVPHTTSTARTNAQRQRDYRQRLALTRTPEQKAAFLKAAAEKRRESRLRQAASRTPEQAKAFAKAVAERQRMYKLRKSANIALTSGTSESPDSTSCSVVERTSVPVVVERRSVPLTNAERQRAFRQRRAALAALHSSRTGVQPNTSSSQTAIQLEQSTWYTKCSSSIRRFQSTFLDNDFGHACSNSNKLDDEESKGSSSKDIKDEQPREEQPAETDEDENSDILQEYTDEQLIKIEKIDIEENPITYTAASRSNPQKRKLSCDKNETALMESTNSKKTLINEENIDVEDNTVIHTSESKPNKKETPQQEDTAGTNATQVLDLKEEVNKFSKFVARKLETYSLAQYREVERKIREILDEADQASESDD